MAEENLAGIKIKNSYEGLLHLSDGGLSTTPGLPTAKPVYDGQGRQTCLNVSSNMLTIKGVAAGLAIDSTNDGDYGFIDQGTTNSGIGLRGFGFYDGTQSSDLFVSSDGNVGVGTEEPGKKLHIVGEMRYEFGTPAVGQVLTCTNANGDVAWKSIRAEVQHDGNTATKLANCTVTRTSAGKYTITIPDNGSNPTAVGSLAHAWASASPPDNNGNMNDQYSISVRTISSTQIKVEIVELYVRVDRADGDDDFEMSQFYRVFRDQPFQVIIVT